MLTHFPQTLFFCPENVVCFLHLLHLLNFRLDFIMKANTMNPDQNRPFGRSLICVCIVYTIGYLKTLIDERSRQRKLRVNPQNARLRIAADNISNFSPYKPRLDSSYKLSICEKDITKCANSCDGNLRVKHHL